MKKITEIKTEARKNIAKYERALKEGDFDKRHDLILKIAKEKFLINSRSYDDAFVEMVHNLRHASQSQVNCNECLTIMAELNINNQVAQQNAAVEPNLGQLKELLEKNANDEWYKIGPTPSNTDLERWALKSAVSDYYNSNNADPMTKITDSPESLKTRHEFAPNKQSIYSIWMDKLTSLTQRKDSYKLDSKKLEESVDRGIPQGGAFEKQLDRYREDFMQQLTNKR